jgi:hypothetical protein
MVDHLQGNGGVAASLCHEDSEMTDLSVSDFPLGQGKYYDIDRIFTRGTQFANEFEPSEDVSRLGG